MVAKFVSLLLAIPLTLCFSHKSQSDSCKVYSGSCHCLAEDSQGFHQTQRKLRVLAMSCKTLNGLVLLPLCFHLLVHFFHHQPYGLLRCSLNPPQHTPTSKTCFFISKYLYSSLFTLFTIQINDSLPERPYLTVYSV